MIELDGTKKITENITDCLNPWITGVLGRIEVFCEQCQQMPYRIIVIEASDGTFRNIVLCGRHFSEFFTDHPQWQSLLQ
jgi:hypothetical protein